MRHRLAGFLLLALALPAWAQAPVDALQWLQRVADAAQKLTYAGTFVYQSGQHSETSRITHLVEGGDEFERLEVLDGSPREVVRINDEVRCFLPESRLLIVERRRGRQAPSFPALLPGSLAGLGEHYLISKGAAARLAGFESQAIVIKPKDDLRYGHRLWVESASGLLLKASVIDERGEPLETFAFTELRIGGPVERASLKPRNGLENGWTVRDVRTMEPGVEDNRWQFRHQVPGFRKVAGMKRQGRPDGPDITHVIFSDGLAAISVFIEPLGPSRPEAGAMNMGAVNAYKRIAGEHLFVVMGDVPLASLKKIADGIELKK